MLVSTCCESKFVDETDLCSDCKEHSDSLVIPTTHAEKSFYLYGDIDMGKEFKDEIPHLERRIALLEEHKIKVLFKQTTATTYKHVTDILNAQKHFENMIAEIKASIANNS